MPSFSIHGVTIDYIDQGKGLPVVLLHAFPVNREMWSAQVAELSRKYRVIAPDLPGFGRSKADGSAVSMDRWADELHALLAAIGALPCVLGGLSLGGYVSIAFARRHSADLKGLILMDTRPDADSPQAREGRQKAIETVRQKGAAGITEMMTPRLLAPGATDRRPELVRAIREMAETITPANLELAIAALRDRPDSTPILPNVRVPTLVVVGDSDQVTPPEIAEKMRDAIPGATLQVIRGAGHMTAIEQPSQLNQAIESFLRKI